MKSYRTSNGPCPYLADGQWITHVLYADRVPATVYENLLEQGWRRSGSALYHTICPGCTNCIPIRVDTGHFYPDRSQKRTLARNQDITVERIPAKFFSCDYTLYATYCLSRHNQQPTEEDYYRFLIQSPVTTEIMRYRAGTQLVAVAWIDLLPNSVSSVYCAYDLTCAQRSPGTLSILHQVMLCRQLNKPWLYLGFYVPQSPRMEYKKNFKPCQVLMGRQWQAVEDTTLKTVTTVKNRAVR